MAHLVRWFTYLTWCYVCLPEGKLTVLYPAALHKRRMTSSRSWHGDSNPARHGWRLVVVLVGLSPIHIPWHHLMLVRIDDIDIYLYLPVVHPTYEVISTDKADWVWLNLLIPLIVGVITHFLNGINHQVGCILSRFFFSISGLQKNF